MSENLQYTIEENNIVIEGNQWFEKRTVATFTDKNKETTIGFLQEKYTELEKEVASLVQDYNLSADKVKLAGKISRTKQYICTAKAIGNFATLLQPLDNLESAIAQLVEENIAERTKICEEAEAITSNTADWKSNTEKLNELTKKLKTFQLVPDVRMEELKNRFEKVKDEFFAKKQGHFDDQDKILLDNLAHKMEICEEAEALSVSNEFKKTSDLLNALTEKWKAIGAVPRHRNDELWLRFCTAKDGFYARKKEYYEKLKGSLEENYTVKLALIAKAEALKNSTDWKKTTEEYNALMEEWKTTGRVATEQNDEVWNKFNEARNHFYTKKEEYYSSIKMNLEDNYAKKMAIVTRTEEIATALTGDWESATAEILEMNEEWRKIGRIGKEHGDEPWERFLKAKKTFFDAKDADREKRRGENHKIIDEKINRNRGYFNKISKELEMENEVLADFEDRLKNIVPGIRSFETQERYQKIINEAKEKITFLEAKIADVKKTLNISERDFNHGFKNKPRRENNNIATPTTKPEKKEEYVDSTDEKDIANAIQALMNKTNKK